MDIQRSEPDRAPVRLRHLSEPLQRRVEPLTNDLLPNVFHEPTARMRVVTDDAREGDVVKAARFLVGIEEADGDGKESWE